MTAFDWVCIIYSTIMALGAAGYRRRLLASRAMCSDLRQALRQRDDAGREPERVAFRSGYQVGLRAASATVEIDTFCDCPQCRAEKWVVN